MKVTDLIRVKGRGLILVGQLIDGALGVYDRLTIEYADGFKIEDVGIVTIEARGINRIWWGNSNEVIGVVLRDFWPRDDSIPVLAFT